MQFINWEEPTGKTVFVPAEKEMPDPNYTQDLAYWAFSKEVHDRLGATGGTLSDIYHGVSAPLRLSLEDTRKLVRGAKKSGYMK